MALATAGIATAGAMAQVPLDNAIEIHKNHLSPESGMPDQARNGLQNALDKVTANQERWLQSHESQAQPEESQNETGLVE